MLKQIFFLLLLISVIFQPVVAEEYAQWRAIDDAIIQPLAGLTGNVKRGRELVKNRSKGNCLACHAMPVNEEKFHGTVAPPLDGIATRLTAGQLRLRVVDEQSLNPYTIMPGYYRNPEKHNRVSNEHYGKTVLTAQEVEDVVAYLQTLK